ncbi:hypothetical protein [Mucilaginibacter sp.]|uniref:hypothetical protein n=1 Tax=Mucilaginibacter sp. TaxID=1882438 RepID=UPI0032641D69
MKSAFVYSLKVWFTALLLTPTIAYFIWELGNFWLSYIHRNDLFSVGIIYGTNAFKISNLTRMFFRNIIYYIPYFLVAFVFLSYFSRQRGQSVFAKLILTFITTALTLCSFIVFETTKIGVVFNEKIAWIISFGLFFMAGIWVYKMK